VKTYAIADTLVTVDELRPSGHALKGRIFADPNTPDEHTATYEHIMPGDRYDVEANPQHPSYPYAANRGGCAPTLHGAVRTAKRWADTYLASPDRDKTDQEESV